MPDFQKNFEAIIAKYRLSFFKIAATFEADPVIQQDLLQEIFLAVWQALASFREQSSLHTFVYRVAYNQALSHVTKQIKSKNIEELSETITDSKSDVEQRVRDLKSMEALTNKIRLLPIVQRQLVVLSLEGVSYKEMAEISGLSQTNVGVQLNRAKSKLIQLMEKH